MPHPPSPAWKKTKLLDFKHGYSIAVTRNGTEPQLFIGSEVEGPSLALSLDGQCVTEFAKGPGGSMAIIPAPDRDHCLLSIAGMFPPFIGQAGAILKHERKEKGWGSTELVKLPFAHRMDFLETALGRTVLIVAAVAQDKHNPDDWEHPGPILALPWDPESGGLGQPETLDLALVRNHGMLRKPLDDRDAVWVSGAEGIFAIQPAPDLSGWAIQQCFDREVSEFVFLDLDGDGHEELITIEPFHGNLFRVYRRVGQTWELTFEDTLSFGHGLAATAYQGYPMVAVGNRADHRSLFLYNWNASPLDTPKKSILDRDVGPTQTLFFEHDHALHLLSCNPTQDELACYTFNP